MNIVIQQHVKTPSESVKRLLNKLALEQKVLHYGKAVDKLIQYQWFKENNLPHPDWTTDVDEACIWLEEGNIVIGRKLLKSGAGNGIVVLTHQDQDWPESIKVYTRYIKKKREFRVNLFQHQLVNIREKLKVGEGSSFIRNRENGWTTAKLKSPAPEGVVELALAASKVSKSDFIGVDIGYNEFKNLLFVLEVNSGPSIEGSSVDDFAKVIKETYASSV